MAERPPEQQEAKRIAEEWLAIEELHDVADIFPLARAHLNLLAAYEDRSKAFERAAADCVRLEGEKQRLYGIVEDIYLEELNGVLCTPPYKTTEDKDGFGGFSYPDYDAAVSRMYCASCRSIWRRIAAAVRKQDEADVPAEAEEEQHAHAEHLREAREVEQHQEEKHGE